MAIVPFSEFAPDLPDLSASTDIALNVIPRTPESYGPFSGLASYSANALDGPCIGCIGTQDVDDSVHIFAGSSDKLYQMTGAINTWADVSGASYTTAPGDFWRFAQFKRIVIATNFGNPIQSFNFGGSANFATLSAGAPQARHLAVAKNFLILGNTSDPVGGINPGRMWWSANGDPTNFPVPGSSAAQQTQSDYNDEPAPLGDISGLAPNLAGCDCAVFLERGVMRMIYVGPPDVFDFFPAENVRGTRASNAITPLGSLVYYLGEDGFYVFDGTTSTPIGKDKVDKWFFSQVNQAYIFNVVGAADVINKAIIWIYPSNASVSGQPDSAILYRWDIGRWSPAQFPAEWITRLLSFGVSMDAMPSMGFTDLDTLPYSLDSRVWIGGALQLGAIDSSHRLAFFTGSNLQAQLGTQVAQIVPGRRAYVQSVRPLVDAPAPTIAVSARVNYSDPEVFGPEVAVNQMGECPQRADGRYHRARLTVPAGQSWQHALGVDVTAIPAGKR